MGHKTPSVREDETSYPEIPITILLRALQGLLNR